MDVEDVGYRGALTGRFFRLQEPLEVGLDLLDRAQPHAWQEELSYRRSYRSFCTSTHPHEGTLDYDEGVLAYTDDCEGNTGVYRLYVRHEDRKVSRAAIEAAAKQILTAEVGSPDPRSVSRELWNEFRGVAHANLLRRAVPTWRIVPIIAAGDLVWVGTRSSFTDRTYRALLAAVLGPCDPLPGLWPSESKTAWHGLSFALVLKALREEEGDLDADAKLVEFAIKGDTFRLTSGALSSQRREIVRQLVTGADVEISRIVVVVSSLGEKTLIKADALGGYLADGPAPAGGLPEERLRSRLASTLAVYERVGEIGDQVVAEIEAEEQAEAV